MRILSLFFFVFILLFNPVMGQTEGLIDDFEDEVVASYEYFYSVSRERVYTHFNKSSYLPGDGIWFKSYVFNPQTQWPSIITRNLWVSLYDPNGELIERKILSVFQGSASNVFALAPDCEPGVYTFKAHTNWMRNFGEELEELSYLHVLGDAKNSLPADDSEIDIQLLPESGTLLAGITNKLGIKALNKEGRGVRLYGKIVNSEGVNIQSFELNNLGMGSISLNLGVEDKLSCEIVLPSGRKVLYPLPGIQEQGIVAQVSQLRNRVFINIASNSSTITEPTHFYAMIHSQGDVKRSTLVSLDTEHPSQLIEFDASRFRGGVNYLTLFDAEYRPVAERLFFVDSEESQGNIDFQVASARDTVTLTLLASKVGNPIEASLSLSVLPEGTRSSLFKNSLFAQVQLSGLKGYVESPAHYFDKGNVQRLMDLDALMLTQGWRRYEWNRILEGKPLELTFENEKGFSIQGEVDRWTSQLQGKAKVSYVVLSNGAMGFVAPDSEGRFKVSGLELYDSTLVYLSVADEKGRGWDRKVTAESSVIPVHDFGVVKPRYSFLANQINLSALDMSIYPADITIEEVRFVGKRILPPEASDLFMAYGGKSYTVTQENAEKYSNVNDILRQEFAVTNIGTDQIPEYRMNRGVNTHSLGTRVLIVIDDIPLSTDVLPSYVRTTSEGEKALALLSISDIESISVNKTGFGVGLGGVDGVIMVKTRTSPLNSKKNMRIPTRIKVNGYASPVEYYAPRYTVLPPDPIYIKYATVYWQPDVITDTEGNATVRFAIPRRLQGIDLRIEGMANDGTIFLESKTVGL